MPTDSLAMMYLIASSTENTKQHKDWYSSKSREWVERSAEELGISDSMQTLSANRWLVKLRAADEARAMRVARLLRNSFQFTVGRKPGNRLSIGIVMVGYGETDLPGCLLAAKKLACSPDAGVNHILYCDYREKSYGVR